MQLQTASKQIILFVTNAALLQRAHHFKRISESICRGFNIAKVKVKFTNVLGECVVNHGFEV